MGQSIFDIESKYLNLIDDIETNEGEITADIEELLAITEDDFKDKMNAYEHIIITMNSEIELAKNQIDKFKAKINSKNNVIERLKKVMLQAVILMGDTGKSGNKTLKTDLFNFYTKGTTTVEVDPIQFTLADERIYPYAKVKLPLVLTPNKYNLLLDVLVEHENNEGSDTLYQVVKNSIISVEPDKRLLTNTLKDAQSPELELDGDKQVIAIPGVKLVTNQSIQVK